MNTEEEVVQPSKTTTLDGWLDASVDTFRA